jgi:hypothetical protein
MDVGIDLAHLSSAEFVHHIQSFYHQLVKDDGDHFKAGSLVTSMGSIKHYVESTYQIILDIGTKLPIYKLFDSKVSKLPREKR